MIEHIIGGMYRPKPKRMSKTLNLHIILMNKHKVLFHELLF